MRQIDRDNLPHMVACLYDIVRSNRWDKLWTVLAARCGVCISAAVAVRRHDPDAIVHEVLTAYDDVLGKST